MKLHILGICGTFMSGLAILARQAGYDVTGCDRQCYSPVRELLESHNIQWIEGYDVNDAALDADCVIVGNAIKRGMPVIEAVLNAKKPYTSGPQWLAENILPRYKKVIAVAGTHGKTTTTSMLAYIIHHAGLKPGFLIGGVASDLDTNACLGEGDLFVIEADEYDSAFFDKRPKFMHYRPDIAILTNLEFDHADIYQDLSAIQQQFHYFIKTIPANGVILKPRDSDALQDVLQLGTYSGEETLALSGSATWQAKLLDDSGSAFRVIHNGLPIADVSWSLIGTFNVENALAAIAASKHVGVDAATVENALEQFTPVKRRLEKKYERNGITIYDDFAHHPTAIQKTIEAVRKSYRHHRVMVVLELTSFTMRTGGHASSIAQALKEADSAYVLKSDFFTPILEQNAKIFDNIEEIINILTKDLQEGDAVVVMSNRDFGNMHDKLRSNLIANGL